MESLCVERLHRPWRLHVDESSPNNSSSTPLMSLNSPCCSNVQLATKSAPSSPHHNSWSDYDHSSGLQVAIPFSWEESPGTPKAKYQAFKDPGSHFSKHSEFEFPSSSLHRFSIENPVHNLTETRLTYFSAPSSPGLDYRWNENISGYELQDSVKDESDRFEFASKRSDADSVTSAQISSADELFFQGLILPLKPPPRLEAFAFTDESMAVYDKGFKNDSAASQSANSAWRWRKGSGACDLIPSCFDTTPARTDIATGEDSSFLNITNRKGEWIKSLSGFRFLRKCLKGTANTSSLQSLPNHQRTKSGKPSDVHGSRSNNFQSLEQSNCCPSETFSDVHMLKEMALRHRNKDSKCSENSTPSVSCSLPQRWLDKPNRKSDKYADQFCSRISTNRNSEKRTDKSCSRISAKTINQISGANSSSTPPHLLSIPMKHQYKGQGLSDVYPGVLHYNITKEPNGRRATPLGFKRGSLFGCFNFAIFFNITAGDRHSHLVI